MMYLIKLLKKLCCISMVFLLTSLLLGATVEKNEIKKWNDGWETDYTYLPDSIYIFHFVDEKTNIVHIPNLPGDGWGIYYAQKMNGKYMVRIQDDESAIYSDFDTSSVYWLDMNLSNFRFQKAPQIPGSNQYTNVLMLNNGNLVLKKWNGHYRIFDGNGTKEAVRLNLDYGKELDLPNFPWEYWQRDLAEDGQDISLKQTTYVGISLDYNPHSKRYVMLLGLNPYYGSDGSILTQKVVGPLYLATFFEDGTVDKIFKIPGVEGTGYDAIRRYYDIPDPNLVQDGTGGDPTAEDYENYGLPLRFFAEQPDQVLIAQSYLVDIEKETAEKVEEPPTDCVPYGSSAYISDWEQLPFKVVYTKDEKQTWIVSKDGKTVYAKINERCYMYYPTMNADGSIDAIFAKSL